MSQDGSRARAKPFAVLRSSTGELVRGLEQRKLEVAQVAASDDMLWYCPTHDAYYRGEAALTDAMPVYDRHQEEVRAFFSSPVAFHTALKHARSMHPDQYCRRCTDAVGFN